MFRSNPNNGYITLKDAKKKYGNDPYFQDLLKTKKQKGSIFWNAEKGFLTGDISGVTSSKGKDKVRMTSKTFGEEKFNDRAFQQYISYRDFQNSLEDRAKNAAQARADEFASDFSRDGAQASAGADARDYSSYNELNLSDLNKNDRSETRKAAAQQMLDLYGSDPYFADFIKAGNRATTGTVLSRGRDPITPNTEAYIKYVQRRSAEDARQARIDAASAPAEAAPTTDEVISSGGTLQEIIDSGASEQDVIDAFLGGTTQGTLGQVSGGDAGPVFDYSDMSSGGINTSGANQPVVVNGIEGISGTSGGQGQQGLFDYSAMGSPNGTGAISGSITGLPSGQTGQATGQIIGGASSSNPIFDDQTAAQALAAANAAEAVELMDAGYGRYNAAVRKLGIIGRQGEEYAPLILDQLRMAEMEAAQPQFAAFGFGENPMLGGMPQIGVQGVQGNVGGQSALSALSNAGLNQLQVSQQPYNRIALPDIDDSGQPISQVNNPTIFRASTSV